MFNRYPHKKLISKISVDTDIEFASYVELHVFAWPIDHCVVLSVCRQTETTNWTVSLSNDWICKKGYAHKHYVVLDIEISTFFKQVGWWGCESRRATLKQYSVICSEDCRRMPPIFNQTSLFDMIVMYINKLRYPVQMKAKGGLIVTKFKIL